MTALNRKTLQTGSSRPDQDLPRWMHAEPTPLSWRVAYYLLLAITIAWAVVLGLVRRCWAVVAGRAVRGCAMSETVRNLIRLRGYVFPSLHSAIDHAIALALEAEFVAGQASNYAQTGIPPVYPPLVSLLALAAPEEPTDD